MTASSVLKIAPSLRKVRRFERSFQWTSTPLGQPSSPCYRLLVRPDRTVGPTFLTGLYFAGAKRRICL